jgi:hypothetical protein
MLLLVWGVALLALLALAKILVWKLRARTRAVADEHKRAEPIDLFPDALLFSYGGGNVRRMPQGDVVVRVPDAAWERDWHEDRLRFDVTPLDPSTVAAQGAWGEVEVLSVYDLRAHRVTGTGTEIAVSSFAAPIDVCLVGRTERGGLRVAMSKQGTWTLAPPAALPLSALQEAAIPASPGWAAASISHLCQVCLVHLPFEDGA